MPQISFKRHLRSALFAVQQFNQADALFHLNLALDQADSTQVRSIALSFKRWWRRTGVAPRGPSWSFSHRRRSKPNSSWSTALHAVPRRALEVWARSCRITPSSTAARTRRWSTSSWRVDEALRWMVSPGACPARMWPLSSRSCAPGRSRRSNGPFSRARTRRPFARGHVD